MRVESAFSLHRSNTLSITWGGLLERQVKIVKLQLFTWLSKGIAIGILGYRLKSN